MSEKVLPTFIPFWKQCNRKSSRKLYKVLKGGRGSAKSTHIAERIIIDLMRYKVNALAVRKVGNTLAESVFEQLKWAIDYLGVSGKWEEKKSPLKLIYKPFGNMIIFRGGDKPEKIKSLKTSKYPVAILWIEELADFKTEEEVSIIVNSVLRAQLPDRLHYDIYFSYNPPKRKQSWVNKRFETHDLPGNVYVNHSTYHDNPHISQEFKDEAAETKRKNSLKYRWEYGGEPIGSGVVPFNNLKFEQIPDVLIETFDNISQGQDWGYGIDPAAFVRVHYDKTRRILYIYDEIYGVKISNRKLAAKIKDKGYHTTLTIADNEPKSVDDLIDRGCRFESAKKGAGSVEYGENWLDDLNAIIIDPIRCPKTATEFENIDYATDAHGETLDRLEDKDNHAIDSTRYACEPFMRRYGAAEPEPESEAISSKVKSLPLENPSIIIDKAVKKLDV
jgi:PBSX family phage terminase large subunit